MGYPPWLVRPRHIAGYWSLDRRTWDRDVSGRGIHLAPVNGPTWAAGPPVVRKYRLEQDIALWRRLAQAPVVAGETLEIAVTAADSAYWKAGPVVVGS